VIPDLLRELLTTPGAPGQEGRAVAAWQAAAEQFAGVSVDAMGTPVARVGGRGEHPLLAVVGHIDEIAVLVSHVTKEGYLKVVSSGGWDPQILVGQRVQVLGAEGPVPGVCGRKPIHLLEAEERKKAVDMKGLHVDIGAAERDEALELVRPGDSVVIDTEPVELRGSLAASRALDNRLGVYVALEVARRVADQGGGAGPVAAVAAVQEEIGALGARAMAYGLEPDVAIVVDVTHSTDAPGVEAGQIGEHGLGDGPVITRGAIVSARVNHLIDEAAEAEGIATTTEVAGRGTHTDADSIHLSRSGVPTAVVSIPLRYMHSPVELVDMDDVEAVIALIAAFALRLEADTSFARWG